MHTLHTDVFICSITAISPGVTPGLRSYSDFLSLNVIVSVLWMWSKAIYNLEKEKQKRVCWEESRQYFNSNCAKFVREKELRYKIDYPLLLVVSGTYNYEINLRAV